MNMRRRTIDLARRATGRGVVHGNFDGFDGASFGGWLREGRGGGVSLKFGDDVLVHARAIAQRSDLAVLGIEGAGFSIPAASVETGLRAIMELGSDEPRVLRAVSLSGDPLGQASLPITAADLLGLLAVSTAVHMLAAPLQGDAFDV